MDALTIGAASVYVAPVGTALPSYDQIADLKSGALATWMYLGDTTAAVSIKDEPEFIWASSQQAGRAIDGHVKETKTTIGSTARAITARKLADWLRGASVAVPAEGDAPSHTKITPGRSGSVPKFALVVVGPWDEAGESLTTVARAANSRGVELAFSSEAHVEVPFEFIVLEAPTGDDYTVLVP